MKGDSCLQESVTVFWWASLESPAGSYQTGPHILSYFDNFIGPVDSFGYDRHLRLL